MKQGVVIKSAVPADDEMALVNRYTRRTLSADEVYLFSVVLCDNDIDRDGERFTVESLFALEKLFVGKTGIIDHAPSAANMKARIISCEVKAHQGRKTALGDDYFCLTARAYIPRSEDNAPLIDAIDTGIVKEVSVGCAVEHTVCSICGQEMRSSLCSHIRGREYDGRLCYGELCSPSDAYEFSFVAVPSQRDAGVTKAYTGKERTMKEIMKAMRENEEITLSRDDSKKLLSYIDGLERDAEDAKIYRNELECEILLLSSSVLSSDTARPMLSKLTVAELRSIKAALESQAARHTKPQLVSEKENSSGARNTQFTI